MSSLWPSSVEITVPVYERLNDVEEARLGNAGIKKGVVGWLLLRGECRWGCAKVWLTGMKLMRGKISDGEIVWEWKKEQ